MPIKVHKTERREKTNRRRKLNEISGELHKCANLSDGNVNCIINVNYFNFYQASLQAARLLFADAPLAAGGWGEDVNSLTLTLWHINEMDSSVRKRKRKRKHGNHQHQIYPSVL